MAFHSGNGLSAQSQGQAGHEGTIVVLYVVKSHERVSLEIKTQAILGRAAAQPASETVYLDLTQFGGFDNGVSRRHLMLALDHQQHIVAFDLNSYNGSFLNGKRMSPNISYMLHQGDHLRLGALELEVHATTTEQAQDTVPLANRDTTRTAFATHSNTQHGQTQKLQLPNPKPDIRNTLQMKPVHTSSITQNEKRA